MHRAFGLSRISRRLRGAVLLLPPTLAQEVSHDKKSTRKSLFWVLFGYLFFKSLVYSVDCGEDEIRTRGRIAPTSV